MSLFDSKQVKAAKAAFRKDHPSDIPRCWRSTKEKTRWVIMLVYGSTRPPNYCFYAVDRATYATLRLEDDSSYAPKFWL